MSLDARNLLQSKTYIGTQQICRSGTNKLLGLANCKELKQARDKRFNLKFTPTKDATSSLTIPQREGYHQETLASPNPHKGRLVLTKNSPQRRGEIQTISGAPHKEGTQWVMPNHLEASFKSNKCESMPGDASSALEMKGNEGALKATQSHTLNHFHTQAQAQRNQVLALGGRGGED
jgi:hypothetical protein